MANYPLWKRMLVLGICLVGIIVTLPNFFYSRVERANDARAAVERGAPLTPELEAEMALWPAWLPSRSSCGRRARAAAAW